MSHGGHSFPQIFSSCNSPFASRGEDTCAFSWGIPHKCLEQCYWSYSFLQQMQNILHLILLPNPWSSILGEEEEVLWINKSFNLILREITNNSDVRNQNKKKYWELFTDLSWVAWRSRAAITGVCGFNSRAERWFIQSTHWLAATQRISEVSHCCSQYTFRSQFIPGWMLPSNNKCSEMHYTNIHISGNEWKAS